MFKNYIFDLYGTLVDIHTDESKRSFWEKVRLYYCFQGAEYTTKEIKKNYRRLCQLEEAKLSNSEEVEIDITRVFQQLYQDRGVIAAKELVEETAKIFRILSLEYVKLYEGVIELLDALRKEGKKIYLLSNAQRVFTLPEFQMLKLPEYFDGILLSSDYGYKKPSPKFYQALIEQYQLDPKESIMIGNDYIADIRGAKEAGLATLYIHSNISPQIEGELLSDYAIMDGNVRLVKDMIL
ncbi:MAG: HAD family hydrolase [Mobilitalea sp.]